MRLKIGCCGWSSLSGEDAGEGDWRRRFSHKLQLYAAHFSVVEINSTFYRLPRPATAQRWRELADEVNPAFEFTVKVNQVVTHKARFRGQAARDAFSQTVEIARLLRAELLLLQCPPSFSPTPENEAALRNFLEGVDRKGVKLVWEPRGKWLEHPELIAAICRDYGLIHCTDPFRTWPVGGRQLLYLRLHGAPPGERMYYYRYQDADLVWLKGELEKRRPAEAYVLFNNIYMAQDALRFSQLWKGEKWKES